MHLWNFRFLSASRRSGSIPAAASAGSLRDDLFFIFFEGSRRAGCVWTKLFSARRFRTLKQFFAQPGKVCLNKDRAGTVSPCA